jgi:hypothetical protein
MLRAGGPAEGDDSKETNIAVALLTIDVRAAVMKPETLSIFRFFVSLIAFQLLGLLVYFAALTVSSYSPGINNAMILLVIAIFAVIAALLTALKVYAIERN